MNLSKVWEPQAGPQAEFFYSSCREILYGGAAGGGKSEALTALPLRWAHLEGFLSLTLRRETTQLKDLTKKSRRIYRKAFPGLTPIKSPHFTWHPPTGAELAYGHCKNEDDYAQYDGWELNLVLFDELTHFTEEQYTKICARVRTSDARLPTLIRATTNPGGPGHDWVFRHWGAWLDPDFEAKGLPQRFDESGARVPPAKPGEVWWIRASDDGSEEYFAADPGFPENPALSRTFIPARLEDNQILMRNDPSYLAQLNKLDAVRRAQLKLGDWLIKPAAGLLFKRAWVNFVDAVPAGARRVRYWDLAGTEEGTTSSNPDWTVGLLLAKLGEKLYVEDVIRVRKNPGEVESLILATAELDGTEVFLGLPQDPGQAGKFQAKHLVAKLEGFTVLVESESGDKVTRFGPFSAQAEHGNVYLVRGAWNKAYIAELESFPSKGEKDDQVDASSGAYKRMVSELFLMLSAMDAINERGGRLFND